MAIPLSRTKLVLALAGSAVFAVSGVVLYRLDDAFIRHQHRYFSAYRARYGAPPDRTAS